MKRNKVLLAVLSLVLVAVVSVAGTLAYLKATSGTVTNTFTVGKVYIELKEKPVDAEGKNVANADYTETANEYHLYPGQTYDKAVAVLVGKAGKDAQTESEDCYLFIKLVNGLADFEDDDTIAAQLADNGWTFVETKDGADFWQYDDVVEDDTVVPLFNTITIKDDYDGTTIPDDIVIVACAVQAKGLDIDDAYGEAVFE